MGVRQLAYRVNLLIYIGNIHAVIELLFLQQNSQLAEQMAYLGIDEHFVFYEAWFHCTLRDCIISIYLSTIYFRFIAYV